MTSSPLRAANSNNNTDFIAINVLDASGNPYFKSLPGDSGLQATNLGGSGGGEDTPPLWKLDVRRDVQIAKWGLAALVTAFAMAFMFFIGEFKDVRKDISSIQISQAGQAATTSGIQTTLTRIEDKLSEDDPRKEITRPQTDTDKFSQPAGRKKTK